MKVSELIAILNGLDQEKSLLLQVVAENGDAWNMFLDVNDIPSSSFVQIRAYHPKLKSLHDKVDWKD